MAFWSNLCCVIQTGAIRYLPGSSRSEMGMHIHYYCHVILNSRCNPWQCLEPDSNSEKAQMQKTADGANLADQVTCGTPGGNVLQVLLRLLL